MSFGGFSSPSKSGNSQIYNGHSTSPQSFVPLLSPGDTEDISTASNHQADIESNSWLHSVCSITLDRETQNSDSDDVFTDDDCSIISSKTDKTSATASTESFSQSLLALSDCSPLGESTVTDSDSLSKQQQHPKATHGGAVARHASDLEFFEDLVSEPVLILGVDISHLNKRMQFIVCASGVFFFSLFYGYLQELISVQICNRRLGLFLAMMQFTGYTLLSYVLRTFVYEKQQQNQRKQKEMSVKQFHRAALTVPFVSYLGLSLLRAVDLGMTNLAMQYINYPAKTLMKSSRVVFTMIFGVFIARKKYPLMDYFVVLCMVTGLVIFMHADATSSAVFQPLGVIMLTISLLCDGALNNMSESIMKTYGVGQDEFIFRMYSIALVAISAAAAIRGDLQLGLHWMTQPGTYDEMQQGLSAEEATWSVTGKISVIVLFSSMGFFGSSCSAAITKNFGALTMSITSTARKATTLFLSFFLFNNVCTFEHIAGVTIFIVALLAKSLRRSIPFVPRKRPIANILDSDSFLQQSKSDAKVTIASDLTPSRKAKPARAFHRRPSLSPNFHFGRKNISF